MESLPTEFRAVRGIATSASNRGSSSSRSNARGSNGRGRARGRGRGSSARGSHQGNAQRQPHLYPATQLPRQPHAGYFKPSFVENPWAELEKKLGLQPPQTNGHTLTRTTNDKETPAQADKT